MISEQTFMDIAQVISKNGTCNRAKVGSIIVHEGRIISTGYNGAPTDQDHCKNKNVGCDLYKGNCIRAVHAEMNSICFAARFGVSTIGSTLYSTHAPCNNCCHAIISAGIIRVVYMNYYKDNGIEILKRSGVDCECTVLQENL